MLHQNHKKAIKLPPVLYHCYIALRRLKVYLVHVVRNSCYYLFRLFKISVNKIVFTNFYGKGYGDSPKYIAQEISRRGLNYDMVWLLRKDQPGMEEFSSQIRVVEYGSTRAIYEMVTAKIWVDNCRQPCAIKKRKGQYYIQTWHGGIGIKKVENDVESSLSREYVRDAKADSEKIDLFLSNSEFNTRLFKNSFWYDGNILESGLPRNDVLFDSSGALDKKVKSYFALENNIRMVLYAPTFRKACSQEHYQIDAARCIEALSYRFSGEWNMLLRLHPNDQDSAAELCTNKNVYNACLYPDVQELLGVVDVVITDYSSLMFDYAMRKKPCFLYATDVEEYRKDRDFYFPIDELPFSLSASNDELVQNIRSFDSEQYDLFLNAFFSSVKCYDTGKASALVVDHICKVNWN